MEGFCRGHEIFQAYIDVRWNIFQNFCWATKYFFMFYFHNFIFKLKGLKHKISKLAIKEIYKRHDMWNKSHPSSRCKAKNGKNKKNAWCILTLMPVSLFLAIDTRYNFCDKFSSVIWSVWLHFLNYS